MKQVLALQHVWDDPPGYLGEILQEYGISCEVVNVEQDPMPDPTGYQAVVIMGGPQHVYDYAHLPYIEPEKALLRQAVEADIPVLGICLGGQLLASALGAEVRKHDLTELGFVQIPLTEAGRQEPLFAGLPDRYLGFHWHEDVFELPAGALLLASNERAPNQAFRYNTRAYGLQFHIELNTELAMTWLRTPELAREIDETLGEADASARLAQEWTACEALYSAHTRTLFENFLRIAGLL